MRRPLLMLLAMLSVAGLSPVEAAPPPTAPDPIAPDPADFLDEQGRLDMERLQNSGFEGNLDLTGLEADGRSLLVDGDGLRTASVPEDEHWWVGFRGTAVYGAINALALFNGELIAGGSFRSAGGWTGTNGIARWSGDRWMSMHPTGASILAMTVFRGELIVGGNYQLSGSEWPSNRIARWDGSEWSAVGTGANNDVQVLSVQNDTLLIGGSFTTMNGQPASRIAWWDGETFGTFGSGFDHSVLAIDRFKDHLVVGGYFTQSGSDTVNYIARWEYGSWKPLGLGMNVGGVEALASTDTLLFAGGRFTRADNLPVLYVAQWDGTAWSGMAGGMNNYGYVHALHVMPEGLVASGSFTMAGGLPRSHIARWDGTTWNLFADGANIRDMLQLPDRFYMGGNFHTVDGIQSINLAEWDGAAWINEKANCGLGVHGPDIRTMAEHEGALIVGGGFTWAGPIAQPGLARWDGEEWSSLGADLNGGVLAITHHDGELVIAGTFTMAGGQPANRVAAWNGTSWHPLGAGITATVRSLHSYNGLLYAGGSWGFPPFGSTPMLMQWNGVTWDPVPGFNPDGSTINAITDYQGSLVIGGDFWWFNSVIFRSIAAFDGIYWSSPGGGFFNELNSSAPVIRAFHHYNGELIAGGSFKYALPLSEVGGLARWDGLTWRSLSGARNGDVHCFGDYAGQLVAGGRSAGGSGNKVSFWNGSSWAVPGSGVSPGNVYAVAPFGSSLLIGGDIDRGGATPSMGIARWDPALVGVGEAPPPPSARFMASPNPFSKTTTLSYEIAAAGPIRVDILDVLGRRVAIVHEGEHPAGLFESPWNGRRLDGSPAAPGIYFARLRERDGTEQVVKLTFLR